jgi:peroxiredoxin
MLGRMPKPAVGDPAPDVTALDATGREVTLSSFWRERPIVAVFLRHYG